MTEEHFEDINEFKKKHRLIYSHYRMVGIHFKYLAIFFAYSSIAILLGSYFSLTIWNENADVVCYGITGIFCGILVLFSLINISYYPKHSWVYIFDDGIAVASSPKIYRKIKKGYEYLPFKDISDLDIDYKIKENKAFVNITKLDGVTWKKSLILLSIKREKIFIEKIQEAWSNWKNKEIPEEIKEESTGIDYYKNYEKYWKITMTLLALLLYGGLIYSFLFR